jgi:aminomethyltransferase
VKRSPLDGAHRAIGARMAEFGGWEMPISYDRGTIHEHAACRTGAAMFDVSHLGTLRVAGPHAFDALQEAFTNDLHRIGPGRAQYTHLLDPGDASVLDDIIVWWHPVSTAAPDGDVFDVMPNASNTSRVIDALTGEDRPGFSVHDTTGSRAVIAVQGPTARALVAPVFPQLAAVDHFAVAEVEAGGARCVVAGTGYTGEDGFEVAVPVEHAVALWNSLAAAGIEPAGLGARDTLRLEAGLPLHGHELGPGITPLEANLSWVVRFDKGEFRGRAALLRARDAGLSRRLLGLRLAGRQPAREGAAVHDLAGRVVGHVTSGNFAPTLGVAVAFAFVDADTVEIGDSVTCEVRGKELAATVVKPPFYKRA